MSTTTDDGWQLASPDEAGFAPDLSDRLDARIRDGDLDDVHAVVVARDGRLVVERYYAGVDEAWGRPLGRVAFGPDTLHDLRSVTKSVVGLLYGIALDEGLVPAPDAPLLTQFPDYADLAADPHKRAMTVGHALTMTLGVEWDEGLSYADPRNSERAMEAAPDRCRYVLERPMVDAPGVRWTYNGGATALIARLIADRTGRTLGEYAEEKLFAPLGITAVEWIKGTDGIEAPASGLRLRPRDAAKIGAMAVQDGCWMDKRVVPSSWLADSFRPHAKVAELDYGYQWWLGPPAPDGRPGWIAGFGNGGQRLFLGPRLGLVVMVAAGAYNRPDAWKLPVAVITEIVLPAVQRR